MTDLLNTSEHLFWFPMVSPVLFYTARNSSLKLRVCLHVDVLGREEADLFLCAVFGSSQLTSHMIKIILIVHAHFEVQAFTWLAVSHKFCHTVRLVFLFHLQFHHGSSVKMALDGPVQVNHLHI